MLFYIFLSHLHVADFVDTISSWQDADVTCFDSKEVPAVVIGCISALLATTAVYVWAVVHVHSHETAEQIRALWTTGLCVHVAVAALVFVDAMWKAGEFWPLQALIIGGGSFVTLLVSALVGAYAGSGNREALVFAVVALACACLSNALMLSMLFEYLHKRVNALAKTAGSEAGQLVT